MKLASSLALLGSAYGQTSWIESGNAKDDQGNGLMAGAVLSLDQVNYQSSNQENRLDIDEISTYLSKTGGADSSLYDFGPTYSDVKAPPADDAVSEAINLPFSLRYFGGQSTNHIRISTNGLVILENAQIYEYEPTELPSIAIDAPFVAGFWNDINTKKQGKIFWRLDQNRANLNKYRNDILEGYPEMEDSLDTKLKFALVVTYFKVSHYGAKKATGGLKQNTFQIVIATDGKYSFLINNYHKIEWNLATGVASKAVAGFDIDDQYFAMIEGSMEDASLDWNRRSTNSNIPGRHIFRLDDQSIDDDKPEPSTPGGGGGGDIVPGIVHADQTWPANDNTLGGGIFKYIPEFPIENGTCTIQFPSPVAWFHIFNAHIRADSAVTSMVWKIVAANPTFEPNADDGSFSFALEFNRGFEFSADEITMTCDSSDEFEYAVYSFPQNQLQESGRSNIRKRDNEWDPAASYSLTFVSPVANFTVDDPRISVQTFDNMNFQLSEVPPSLEEIWFQFQYIDYFGSNEVGVVASA